MSLWHLQEEQVLFKSLCLAVLQTLLCYQNGHARCGDLPKPKVGIITIKGHGVFPKRQGYFQAWEAPSAS